MVDDSHKTFLVRYRYDGAEWGFRLPARDFDDAKARLTRLSFATIDGELVTTLPATTGPLAALITGLRKAIVYLTKVAISGTILPIGGLTDGRSHQPDLQRRRSR